MDPFKTFGVKVNIYFMRIIHDELKILVIQKKGKDYWEFPNAIFKDDDEILEVCKRATSQVINYIYLGNFEYKLINNFINVYDVPYSIISTNSITSGCLPLNINFIDSSTSSSKIIDWQWNFGDGGQSNLQNPSYIYSSDGNFSVSLLVTDTNGNIETGDYICSSNRTGHGEKQDDDILHNYTVAKATEPIDFSTIEVDSDLGYKSVLVACTYHCG